jgi:hypothetical protein
MENMIVIIGVIAVAFYIKYYLDNQKDKVSSYVKKVDISQENRPLSRETLKDINQNKKYVKSDYHHDYLQIRIVGVTNRNSDNRNRQDIIRECSEGDKLILVKDIDNKFSKYAIKVCKASNGEQLGYVEDSLSQKVYYRDMNTANVYINRIIGGTEEKPTLGCIIEIQFN